MMNRNTVSIHLTLVFLWLRKVRLTHRTRLTERL